MNQAGDETALKRYLRQHKIGIGALAAELDMNRTHLSELVNGRTKAGAIRRWAPRIAAALGVTVETIFPAPGRKEAGDGERDG